MVVVVMVLEPLLCLNAVVGDNHRNASLKMYFLLQIVSCVA